MGRVSRARVGGGRRCAWALAAIGLGYPGAALAQRLDPAARAPARPLIVQVTGSGISDGSAVTIDEASPVPLASDGSVRFGDLTAGPHTVRLGGLGRCTANPNPRIVRLGQGVQPQIETFRVTCPEPPAPIARLSGSESVVRVVRGEEFTLWKVAENGRDSLSMSASISPTTGTPLTSTASETGTPLTFTASGSGSVVLTVIGSGGSASDTVRVEVLDPVATVPASSPPPVARIWTSNTGGDSTRLHLSIVGATPESSAGWHATLLAVRTDETVSGAGVVSDTLMGGPYGPPFTGAATVWPESTTRYVFTVTGPSGESTAETTIVVRNRAESVIGIDTPPTEDEAARAAGPDWWWGPGVGSAGVITGPASVIVPVVASVSAGWDDNWTVTLQGGLFPGGSPGADPSSPLDPRPAFRARTQKLLSLGVSWFPTMQSAVRWGASLSYVGAWEMVRGVDYYAQRLHGPAVGVRGRWDLRPSDSVRLRLTGGPDLQYAHVSEYDEPVAKWEFGVTLPIVLTLVLD